MTQLAISAQSVAEIEHFDGLVSRTGESWWGHLTAGGRRRLERRAAIIRNELALESGVEVLEIGAGAGALTEAVLRLVPNAAITAVDISPTSIARLRNRIEMFPNARAVVGDITRLNFENLRFGAVIGNSALHHVDVRQCLKELHRVLKPGSRMVIFEPNLLNPEVLIETFVARNLATRGLDYSEHERTFTRWTYRRWLKECGFTGGQVRPFDFLHPITPTPLLPAVEWLTQTLEFLPIVRGFGGSLRLTATRQ